MDKQRLLERLGAKEQDLPTILLTDPALTSLEAKPGDVVRITRKSQTAGFSTYYRLVAAK